MVLLHIHLLEGLEEFSKIFLLNSLSSIFYPDGEFYLPLVNLFHFQGKFYISFLGKFNCIIGDIDNYLAQTQRIAVEFVWQCRVNLIQQFHTLLADTV